MISPAVVLLGHELHCVISETIKFLDSWYVAFKVPLFFFEQCNLGKFPLVILFGDYPSLAFVVTQAPTPQSVAFSKQITQ